MIRSYIKTAFRNLARKKTHSFINIAGLATGMAVTILISLWIWDEFSFNRFHRNYATIGMVMATTTFNNETSTIEGIATPLGAELRNKYGNDFKKIALVSGSQNHVLQVGDNKTLQTGRWAQASFPAIITPRMLKGDINALTDPS